MEKIDAPRSIICTAAMEWVDTPYQHQARVLGVGVDCAQLVMGVAIMCNMLTNEEADKVEPYTRDWALHNKEEKMIGILEGFGCTKVNIEDQRPGDIITFKFGRVASHLGILINDNYIIHAMWNTAKVARTSVTGDWVKRIHSVYRFPGINK